jgi:hypothetical protein
LRKSLVAWKTVGSMEIFRERQNPPAISSNPEMLEV